MQKFAENIGDWNDLKYFLAVARTGRLTAAARRLRVNHSTVERRISALEQALKVKLFERLPSGFELSVNGNALIPFAEEIEASWILAASNIAGGDIEMAGAVRIGAPDGLGTFFLAPRLANLSDKYPNLELELVITPLVMNPSKREVDISIGHAIPSSGHLMAKKLTDYAFHIYVSHSFIDEFGIPKTMDDLKKIQFYGYLQEQTYGTEFDYLPIIDSELKSRLTCSNIMAHYIMTLQGKGAGILPHYIGSQDPKLVMIMPEHRFVRSYYLIYASNLSKLTRIRTTVDALSSWAKEERALLLPS